MKKYETPNISVEKYGLVNNIMAGDIDGDIGELPWGDLFTDPASENVDANILD